MRPEKQWKQRDFKAKIFANLNVTLDTEKKNFGSWLGRKGQYPPGPDYAPKIARELFGNEEKFAGWADDLEDARERCHGPGNNPINITREAALAELARAGLIDGADYPVPPSAPDTDSLRRHLAAAARENVALVVNRLTEFFAGRSADLATIDQFVSDRMAGGNRGLLVVTAPPGFGKSTLAAHWCTRPETLSRYRVARHFCAISFGEATTSLQNVYAHLHQQIAEILNEPIDQSGSFDALAALLAKSPPEGSELVVWLDGIDEAQQEVECFLPRSLGDRICVIVSARADGDNTPAYLEPWIASDMARLHQPVRHRLEKMSRNDVDELLNGRFAGNELPVPHGLAREIFYASDYGHTLFVRILSDNAVEATLRGEPMDLRAMPTSLRGYAKRQLDRLGKLDKWIDLQPVFALLTVAREAVRLDEIPLLLGVERVLLETFPSQLMRWFSVEDVDGAFPPLLSFAHPLLADVFGSASGFRKSEALNRLCDRMMDRPRNSWPEYACRQLPAHLLEAGRKNEAVRLLCDHDFISRRFQAMGAAPAASAMKRDWWRCEFASGEFDNESNRASVHFRVWEEHGQFFGELASQGVESAWRQVLHDLNENDHASGVHLIPPFPEEIRHSIGLMIDYGSSVEGTTVLANGAGYLAWYDDSTFRLHRPAGEADLSFRGHDSKIEGVTALSSRHQFLSWGRDGTLRLWDATAKAGPVMLHELVCGALIISDSRRFLSWGDDGELRLWGEAGEPGAVLRGHQDSINGAISLGGHDSVLSWSDDHTLRLWRTDGDKCLELRGHAAPVHGAIALAGGALFFSWSADC